MHSLLRLEASGFAEWVRESESIFAYAGVLLLHTIGMGIVVGINAVIDLRVLGVAPRIQIRSLRPFLPVLWVGFWINAVTGAVLLVIHASKFTAMPDFYLKLAFIALALINLQLLKVEIFDRGDSDHAVASTRAKALGATSIVLWLAAITAGRLLAYL